VTELMNNTVETEPRVTSLPLYLQQRSEIHLTVFN